jgi:molybdopterin-guanine dinucleotide biosynthesis protein A
VRRRESGMGSLGVILVGGRSSRFGSPKAVAHVGGVALIDRARDALLAVPLAPVLVGGEPPNAPTALPWRADVRPGNGPLGGLDAALRWARDERCSGALVVACDMPFLAPPLLRLLVSEGERGSHTAVAPSITGDRPEPLCAWYSVGLLPLVERRLASGRLGLMELLKEADAYVLPPTQLALHCDPSINFLNVNTPGDRDRAQRIADLSDDR